jgi:hypothetical protein
VSEVVVGEEVRVEGFVAFVDSRDPEGGLTEITADDCRAGVGITVEKPKSSSDVEWALLSGGEDGIAAGKLETFPDLMRPDEEQVTIEIVGARRQAAGIGEAR